MEDITYKSSLIFYHHAASDSAIEVLQEINAGYVYGVTATESLKIPADYKEKIVKVEKYCTKPELELLLIISEGLVTEYDKTKSSMSPKEFAKHNIKCGRKKYDNSTGSTLSTVKNKTNHENYAMIVRQKRKQESKCRN